MNTEHSSDAAPSAAPEMTTGKIIDEMLVLRDKRYALDKESKGLKADYDALESILLSRMRNQDTQQSRSSTATATISETIVPTIKDWDSFMNYVKETDAFHLIQKRPSSTAYRELVQQGEVIPGLEPFTETKINLRRL